MTTLAHNGTWFGIKAVPRRPLGDRMEAKRSLPLPAKGDTQAADHRMLAPRSDRRLRLGTSELEHLPGPRAA